MKYTTFIHPEIRPAVIAEFKRLKNKNPGSDGKLMWELSRDYCFAIAMADTMNFKVSHGF